MGFVTQEFSDARIAHVDADEPDGVATAIVRWPRPATRWARAWSSRAHCLVPPAVARSQAHGGCRVHSLVDATARLRSGPSDDRLRYGEADRP